MSKVRSYLFPITLFFAMTAICCSLFAQYFLKIEPCYLCKLERVFYAVVALVAFWGLKKNSSKIPSILLQLLFGCLVLLSGYHLLVQMHLLSDFCSVPQKIATIEDFENMLHSPIPCSKITWSFLSLPMSAYNLIFSFLFLTLFQSKRNGEKIVAKRQFQKSQT